MREMESSTVTQLNSIARSLQEHISLANDLKLDLTAQLLGMAVMEITTRIHGITPQELDALCERIEQRSSFDRGPPAARVIGLRSFDRRTHPRRNRG
ncbi:MAG: hypothetical protein NVS4B4_13520 [Bradyrhizobium sp.]